MVTILAFLPRDLFIQQTILSFLPRDLFIQQTLLFALGIMLTHLIQRSYEVGTSISFFYRGRKWVTETLTNCTTFTLTDWGWVRNLTQAVCSWTYSQPLQSAQLTLPAPLASQSALCPRIFYAMESSQSESWSLNTIRLMSLTTASSIWPSGMGFQYFPLVWMHNSPPHCPQALPMAPDPCYMH